MKSGSAWRKNERREIARSKARYFAILAIVALGVGFFSGLKVTKQAMLATAQAYLNDYPLYDFRVMSTYGITDDDVKAFRDLTGIRTAAGGVKADFIAELDGSERVLRAYSVTEGVNELSLTAGRLPINENECVLDDLRFGEEMLGRTVTVSAGNDAEDAEQFAVQSFTVVGIGKSPMFLNLERGTSNLGDGTVYAFLYLTREAFTSEYDTELYLLTDTNKALYSDAYKAAIDDLRGNVTNLMESRTSERYREIKDEAEQIWQEQKAELDAAEKTLSGMVAVGMLTAADAEARLAPMREQLAAAREQIENIPEPQVYVLDRTTNTGYVCFENDAAVVEGISKIFPIFFFLVAALVCTTTMTRMVDEQRTQIGTFKALGYGDGRICMKFMAYSGSAALIGAFLGFLAGSALFPMAIWKAYSILYGFRPIVLVINWRLALISFLVALICSVGATWAACSKELANMPAELMRPKAPKAGKRILLERIPFLWKRLPFLHKVSIRNIFRYKKRLVMMLLGIGGCTALVLTGFGVRDSISNIATDQYDNIMRYDMALTFRTGQSEEQQKSFAVSNGDVLSRVVFVTTDSADVLYSDSFKTANVIACRDGELEGMIDLHMGETSVSYPGDGEVVLSEKLAGICGISVGDTVRLRVNETKEAEFTVSGIFENYVYHYLMMNDRTYASLYGKDCTYQEAYATVLSGQDVYTASATLFDAERGGDELMNVSIIKDARARVENMMKSLNYIVWLVIACAGALAFVVLFNLCNINITERVREIATIKVLGFYRGETSAYVFRENILLTAAGALLGLPLGYLLHRFVMSQINIDMVSFKVRVEGISYLFALASTFLFTILVDLIMRRRLEKIDMAQSLKSVE